MALHLEELESIQSVCRGNAKDMETFADLLDILVLNLKDANRLEELGKGNCMYLYVEKRMSQRWRNISGGSLRMVAGNQWKL